MDPRKIVDAAGDGKSRYCIGSMIYGYGVGRALTAIPNGRWQLER